MKGFWGCQRRSSPWSGLVVAVGWKRPGAGGRALGLNLVYLGHSYFTLRLIFSLCFHLCKGEGGAAFQASESRVLLNRFVGPIPPPPRETFFIFFNFFFFNDFFLKSRNVLIFITMASNPLRTNGWIPLELSLSNTLAWLRVMTDAKFHFPAIHVDRHTDLSQLLRWHKISIFCFFFFSKR
jgi:hypothetical protein